MFIGCFPFDGNEHQAVNKLRLRKKNGKTMSKKLDLIHIINICNWQHLNAQRRYRPGISLDGETRFLMSLLFIITLHTLRL